MIEYSLTSSEIQESLDYLITGLHATSHTNLEGLLSRAFTSYEPWSPLDWDELDEFNKEVDALW